MPPIRRRYTQREKLLAEVGGIVVDHMRERKNREIDLDDDFDDLEDDLEDDI
ncbi:hypothetical protein BGZ70_001874, partial [Mortierella alpina]